MNRRRLVLVVEDEPLVAEVISLWVEIGGSDVHIEHNGHDAVSACQRLDPCVVLLDLHLPVLSGRAFVQRIRSLGITTPIVVITSDPNGRAIADQIGAVAFVRKAYDLHRIVSIVDEICPVDAR